MFNQLSDPIVPPESAAEREQGDAVLVPPKAAPSRAPGRMIWVMRLLVAGPLLAALMAGEARGASDEIHWTFTSQTSVTVDWRGSESTLRYGLTNHYSQTLNASTPNPVPISSSGPFWEAKVTGLQENTLYHYSAGGGPDHTFRTPPARGSSGFVVYAQGDIGDSSSYRTVVPVQQQVLLDAPGFVLMLGDLTYANDHGQSHVDQHYKDVQVWSQDMAYMPVWGNHDWETMGRCSVSTTQICNVQTDCPAGEKCNGTGDDLRNYKGRFELPNPQTSPGVPSLSCCGEDWSWFDYGNTRFISYPEPTTGAWQDWRPKASALMDAAEADSKIKFIVTFGHRPAYSSAHHPGSPLLKTQIDALGAAHPKFVLNLNGHSHVYERTFPQSGVIHITSGVGGATMEQDGTCLYLTCAQPAWTAFRAMHLGVLKLRFTANTIEGGFVCGPTGGGVNDVSCSAGSIIDSFVIGPDLRADPSPDTVGSAAVPNPIAATVNTTDLVPPTAAVSAPADGASVSGDVTITASASDNIGVAGLRIRIDGAPFGPESPVSPYSISWNTAAVSNGGHVLDAVARDAAGNITTSSPVSVNVNNSAATQPAVSVTNPPSGTVLSGTIALTAAPSPDASITGVQFMLDGARLGDLITTPPWSMSWNTTDTDPGTHFLTAVTEDETGNAGASDVVGVIITDQQAPAVAITAPASGDELVGSITVSVFAHDNTAIAGVQFLLDGRKLGPEDTSSPYSVTWKTKRARRGPHLLTAVARDAAGNTFSSAAVRVTTTGR